MDITIIILVILVILLLCLLYNFKYNIKEKFKNNENINYYVIHMKNSNNKYNNIIKNEKKLKIPINIYDAVIGKNIDLNNLSSIDPNINFNFNYNYIGELGCYLSHMLLIKSLINSSSKYSVIFEDDLNILDNNLNDKINEIINKLNDNFDIIYLGNLNNNHYERIIDNIYTINKLDFLWGTHAYIINNKNATKIYESLLNIDCAIDNKFKNNINNDTFKAYVIYPILVDQNTDELKSDIRPISIRSAYGSFF
jgi:glycosyl transferase family 25